MKKILLSILAVLAVAACDKSDAVSEKLTYQCGEHSVSISFSEDGSVMNAVISGVSAEFVLSLSASGTRYVGKFNDTDMVLWGKGDTWTMFVGPEETSVECIAK